MRTLLAVVAAGLGLVAVVTTAPALVGLSTTAGVAHAVALRGPGALALAVAAVVLGLVARRRRGGRVAGGLAALLAACAVVHVGVLVLRGVDGRAPGPEADLVVVALNTEVDGVSPEQLADLVEAVGADVVALPETPATVAAAMAAAVDARTGQRWSALTEAVDERPIAATSLLVADRLGALERVGAPALELSAVAARTDAAPLVVAAHPPPPIPGRFPMREWAAQGRTAVRACAVPGAVVAGDLNATLDHAPLRDGLDAGPCVDAAEAAGAGGLGTWPASLPPLLAAPIDHVLVDARAWEPLTADVVRVGGTDHRAVVVGLARR
ncbi:endonuclease/exonuclease/phosphatase family protein [Pseudokineococcus basanitobsidens]|uniref:Endonuclease/exonuclease/phosphatase family protein n=1 Tax=Pseudokineococcus basanitobsidens TaxID=1926649 RepID=A0ABU8RKN6_9ACTN